MRVTSDCCMRGSLLHLAPRKTSKSTDRVHLRLCAGGRLRRGGNADAGNGTGSRFRWNREPAGSASGDALGLRLALLIDARQHPEQQRGIDRFGQVRIHAGGLAALGVLGEGVRREGDDGHGSGVLAVHAAYGGCRSDAVHVGHAQVHENRVEEAWLRIGEELPGCKAIFGMEHARPGLLENGSGDLGVDGLILGEQHPHALDAGKGFFREEAFAVLAASETGQGAVERGLEEGLADEAGKAGSLGLLLDVVPVVGRDEEFRHLAVSRLANLHGRLDAVHARHLVVDDRGKEVLAGRMRPGGHLDSRRAAGAGMGPCAELREDLCGRVAQCPCCHRPQGRSRAGG